MLLDDLLERLDKRLESSKNSVVITSGAVQASREIMTSYGGFVVKRQAEYQKLIDEGKLTIEAANFALGQLKGVVNYLDDKYRDYEKFNHIRQGEVIAISDELENLKAVRASLPPVVEVDESLVVDVSASIVEAEKKTDEVTARKRPDDPSTRMGKVVQDIKRRKAEASLDSQKKSRGRPKEK